MMEIQARDLLEGDMFSHAGDNVCLNSPPFPYGKRVKLWVTYLDGAIAPVSKLATARVDLIQRIGVGNVATS